MTTFVLVHGAWHGGWAWHRVTDLLTAQGHRAYTPSLTGLGDREHLFSRQVSLQTHIDDIVTLVEAEELEDFVLVGHSYAGVVITGVADILQQRVAHYIYLDGGVPVEMGPGISFSWADSNKPEDREKRLSAIRDQGNGMALPAPPPSAFAVTDAADAAWLQRRLRPMPAQTYTGRYTCTHSGSAGLKRTYIASNQPPYQAYVPIYERVKRDPSWTFKTIESGHDSMVTAPSALVALLTQT